MPNTQEISLKLSSELREINRACRNITAFCSANALAQNVEHSLQIVLEELVSNTVRHGLPPVTSPIDIRLTVGADVLRLAYVDRGCPFDPGKDLPADTRELPLEKRGVGGLGWPMILHYCKLVDYRYINGENHYAFEFEQPGQETD